jgi:hypothetical protein
VGRRRTPAISAAHPQIRPQGKSRGPFRTKKSVQLVVRDLREIDFRRNRHDGDAVRHRLQDKINRQFLVRRECNQSNIRCTRL